MTSPQHLGNPQVILSHGAHLVCTITCEGAMYCNLLLNVELLCYNCTCLSAVGRLASPPVHHSLLVVGRCASEITTSTPGAVCVAILTCSVED